MPSDCEQINGKKKRKWRRRAQRIERKIQKKNQKKTTENEPSNGNSETIYEGCFMANTIFLRHTQCYGGISVCECACF